MKSKYFVLFLALVSVLISANKVLFAKDCKKGIPCGGTCIPTNRTCHLDSPSAPSPTEIYSSPAPKSSPTRKINNLKPVNNSSNNSKTCPKFNVQKKSVKPRFSFSDPDGDKMIVMSKKTEKNSLQFASLQFAKNNKIMNLRYDITDWSNYLSGLSNSANYTVWWNSFEDQSEKRTQKGCEGRKSYISYIIRKLEFSN